MTAHTKNDSTDINSDGTDIGNLTAHMSAATAQLDQTNP
jgi:hypothetical protein